MWQIWQIWQICCRMEDVERDVVGAAVEVAVEAAAAAVVERLFRRIFPVRRLAQLHSQISPGYRQTYRRPTQSYLHSLSTRSSLLQHHSRLRL